MKVRNEDPEFDVLRTDLEIIRAALDSLFTSTLILDWQVTIKIVKGLGKLINSASGDND